MDWSEGERRAAGRPKTSPSRRADSPCQGEMAEGQKGKRGGQAHRGDRLRSGWAEPRGSQRLSRVCPESEELSTRPCAQPAA